MCYGNPLGNGLLSSTFAARVRFRVALLAGTPLIPNPAAPVPTPMHAMKSRFLLRWIAWSSFLILATLGAHAANFTPTVTTDLPISSTGAVNSSGQITNQGNAVTLRSAVIAANAAGGTNSITLGAGTYQLTIPGTGERDQHPDGAGRGRRQHHDPADVGG